MLLISLKQCIVDESFVCKNCDSPEVTFRELVLVRMETGGDVVEQRTGPKGKDRKTGRDTRILRIG